MPDPSAINTMFGSIAQRYDLANRLLSGGIDLWWRHQLVHAVRNVRPRQILDLATGSGDVAFALGRALPPATAITGMDFCQPMLDVAENKKKSAKTRSATNITFRLGDGMALPVPDSSVDAVTIAFGLRNMTDRRQSLAEMHRILRPGGSLFVLEFSQPRKWFRPFYYFYLLKLSPWLAGLITGKKSAYEYLGLSIGQFPNRAALTLEIQKAGFCQITAKAMTFGIVALHEAKKTPQVTVS